MSSGTISVQSSAILRLTWYGIEIELKVRNLDHACREREILTDKSGAALAEHIGESKVARVNQQSVNLELLEAQSLARRKEITA